MIDSNIVRTLSNLMNNKNKSQFSLNYNWTSDNSFTINPINPQKIKIEGYNMIFKNGNIYDLRNKDLAYFLSYTNMNENNIIDDKLISQFYKDVKYDLNLAGDKRSNRYKYIKKLSLKASGIVFLSKDPNELVDRLYLLYQEKIAGNDSKNINEEMVAIYDKLYSYNIISEKDHFKMVQLFGLNILYSFSLSLQIVYFSSSSNLLILR